MILYNDFPELFSWMILLSRHQGVDGLWDDFLNIIVVSSRKKVIMYLDLFFCQDSVFVTEKSNSLRAVLHENDFELYLCNIPIRILHLLQELRKSW